MDESFAGTDKVHTHVRKARRYLHAHDAIAESELALAEGGVDDVFNRMGFEAELDFTGIEARHFSGFADEAVQAVGFLIDDSEKLLALLIRDAGVREQVRYRSFDGSQRSAQRVRNGI